MSSTCALSRCWLFAVEPKRSAAQDLLERKQRKEAQQEAQLYDKILVECCPFCETKCCSSGSHKVCQETELLSCAIENSGVLLWPQADFDRFDTDKDGSLSKSEVCCHIASLFHLSQPRCLPAPSGAVAWFQEPGSHGLCHRYVHWQPSSWSMKFRMVNWTSTLLTWISTRMDW